ncbi:hypothetical protein C8Q73DRAFT_835223 [Cubamyces lactineus]|nr:hypothetical protein C8Q73DRAFT_835223 [Cubamyces lactineus]
MQAVRNNSMYTYHTVTILDLPAELLLDIIARLPQQSVLHFTITCKTFYQISLPVLYDTVKLAAQGVCEFRSKIRRNDTCLSWVHELKLLRSDVRRSGLHLGSSCIFQDNAFLSAFPNLRSFDTLDYARMKGWSELISVLEALPSSVLHFRGRVCTSDDDVLQSLGRVYPSYQTLELILSPEGLAFDLISLDHNINNVPPSLSHVFPNLAHLSLTLIFLSGCITSFLRECHFPALETFQLVNRDAIMPDFMLDMAHADALLVFFANHARTLRDLQLPAWAIEPEVGNRFSGTPLTLRNMRSGLSLLHYLAKSDAFSSTLLTLSVSQSAELRVFGVPALPVAFMCFSSVHTLELAVNHDPTGPVLGLAFSFDIDAIPTAFPALECLEIRVHETISVKTVIAYLGAYHPRALLRCKALTRLVFIFRGFRRETRDAFSVRSHETANGEGNITLERIQ